MSLLYKREFLKFYPKSVPYFNVLRTCKLRQYFTDATSYNTGVAVQDNATQQWWYSAILAADTISNTGKFAKMVYIQIFFVKMWW